MPLRLTSPYARAGQTRDIPSAMDDACRPEPYGSNGAVERTAESLGKLQDIVGRLIETLHDKGTLEDEEVAKIIGYGWKVS